LAPFLLIVIDCDMQINLKFCCRILGFIFLLHTVSLHAACRVTDANGSVIELKKPAQRIISLTPDLTEILYHIGAAQQVVGVIDASDYPLQVKLLPKVGSFTGIDLEKIYSLHPDLIVTWGNMYSRSLASIKKLGIPVYVNDPHQFVDIEKTMLDVSCLSGHAATAKKQVMQYDERLKALQQRYAHQSTIKVFFQIGDYSLFTINKTSWINEAITICGGENIFQNARFTAPQVTWEAVIEANPQIVLSDATSLDWRQRWQRWPQMTAVQHQALFAIPPDLIERAGPRILDGVKTICDRIEQSRQEANHG
jgi:iron complex transport system substrate-binding protein